LDSAAQKRIRDYNINFGAIHDGYWKTQGTGKEFYQIGDSIIAQGQFGLTFPMQFPSLEPSGRCNFDRPMIFNMQTTSVTCRVPLITKMCRGPLNSNRYSSLAFAANPDLKTYRNVTVTYIDYAKKNTMTPTQLSDNCGVGDIVTSVFFIYYFKK